MFTEEPDPWRYFGRALERHHLSTPASTQQENSVGFILSLNISSQEQHINTCHFGSHFKSHKFLKLMYRGMLQSRRMAWPDERQEYPLSRRERAWQLLFPEHPSKVTKPLHPQTGPLSRVLVGLFHCKYRNRQPCAEVRLLSTLSLTMRASYYIPLFVQSHLHNPGTSVLLPLNLTMGI